MHSELPDNVIFIGLVHYKYLMYAYIYILSLDLYIFLVNVIY